MKLPRFSPQLFAIAALAIGLVGLDRSISGQGSAQTLTILTKEDRRTIPLNVVNNQEMVFLDDLATVFQLTVREESLATLTVAYKGKTILLTPDQPLASIAGRLVSLPSAPTRSGRRWLLPVEFVNRALSLIYDSRLDLRKASHLVVAGDVRVPRVTIRVESGDPVRLIIESTPRTNSTVSQNNNTLAVRFEADALEAVVPPIQPQALVQAVRLADPATVAIDLGPRFATFKATTQPVDASSRLTIEVSSAQVDAQPASPAPPAQPAPPPDVAALVQQPYSIRTIAVDAGHGGDDEGVRGAGGTKEKDLTLGVARRVKAVVEGRLGIRVLLTRDDDRNVPLDARAALANNNKADLFISVHANSSLRKTTTGASILFAGFDREDERSARSSLGSDRLPTFGGGLRDIDLVLWDLAQIRHIDRSAEFARLLQGQLHDRIPLSSHSIERGPIDVLESANMPAVLVEMGYLSNEAQEMQMAAAEFQNTFVQAIYDALLKFRSVVGTGGAQ